MKHYLSLVILFSSIKGQSKCGECCNQSTCIDFFGPAMNLYSERGEYNILKVSPNDCQPRGTLDPKIREVSHHYFIVTNYLCSENWLVLSSFISHLPWEAQRPMIRQSLLTDEPAWCCYSADCVLNPKFSALPLGYFYFLFTDLKTQVAADRAMAFIFSSSSIKCNHLC